MTFRFYFSILGRNETDFSSHFSLLNVAISTLAGHCPTKTSWLMIISYFDLVDGDKGALSHLPHCKTWVCEVGGAKYESLTKNVDECPSSPKSTDRPRTYTSEHTLV